MKLYMAITADRFELPLFVTKSRLDMASFAELSPNTFGQYVTRGNVRRLGRLRCKFIRVEVDA